MSSIKEQFLLALEGYNKDHKCKTPGAIYESKIAPDRVSVNVKLPKNIKLFLSKKDATDLEADLHYAVEKVLAKFFKK